MNSSVVEDDDDDEGSKIRAWERCAVCGKDDPAFPCKWRCEEAYYCSKVSKTIHVHIYM